MGKHKAGIIVGLPAPPPASSCVNRNTNHHHAVPCFLDVLWRRKGDLFYEPLDL